MKMPTTKKPLDLISLKVAPILLFALGLLISTQLPVPEGMNSTGLTTLVVILFAIYFWLTNILPNAITGMVVVALFPLFGVLPFKQTAAHLGNEIVWLLISTIIMSQAVEKTVLHKRITYTMFLWAKGDLRFILLFVILFSILLTFFIPNVMGRIMLLLPICSGLLNAMKEQGEDSKLRCTIIPTITFVPSISAFCIITGGGGTLYAVHLFETQLGYSWGYLNWFIAMMPIGLSILLLYWFFSAFVFFPSTQRINLGYIQQEKIDIGKITLQEKQIIVFYLILLILWVTKEIHNMPLALSAIMVVSLLFIPGIEILHWKDVAIKMDWGIILVFAAGFSIADAFVASRVTDWFSSISSHYIGSLSAFWFTLLLIICFIIIRIGFVNYTMMIAALMPVVFSLANATKINAIWLSLIMLIASSICFMFPMQTISSMATFSLGYHTFRDHFKVGLLLTLITVIISLLYAFFYWPLIGINIYLESNSK